jgi:hypothetical protein
VPNTPSSPIPASPIQAGARALAAAVILLGGLGCAVVFEAALKAEFALRAAEAAQAEESPAAHLDALRRAEAVIATSWARPLAWHAGADEAQSFIAASIAAITNDPADERRAVAAAARAVDLSPIQPAAWARLGAFAHAGRDAPRCDAAVCLDRSWRAVAIADPSIDCARLRIEARLGRLPPGDPRLDALDMSMDSTRDFARCLAFLPRDQLFEVLMRRAARMQEERAAADEL